MTGKRLTFFTVYIVEVSITRLDSSRLKRQNLRQWAVHLMKKPNPLAVYIAWEILIWAYNEFLELFVRKHEYA